MSLFGALDAFTREQMQDLVLNLWQHNQTGFFLITHDIEEAFGVGDAIGVDGTVSRSHH